MLKIPFIETTFVGVEITDSAIHWVEANKLGHRISIKAEGSIPISASLKESLAVLKNKIESDAYYLGVSNSAIIEEFIIEEVPLSEDESDEWISNYQNKLALRSSDIAEIYKSEIVEIEDDLVRIITQEIDSSAFLNLKNLCKSVNLNPLFITSGLFEFGYSQVLNPVFTDSYSSCLRGEGENKYLVIYKEGRIYHVYNLSEADSLDSQLIQCDSILKSEELSNELLLESIPIFISDNHRSNNINRLITPVDYSNFGGIKVQDQRVSIPLGIIMKLAYPQLDNIGLEDEINTRQIHWEYAKNEIIRLAILLFAPLTFLFFIAYGTGKIVETDLFELSQINESISDNLSIVEKELEQAVTLQDQFQNLKLDIQQKVYVTEVFELIARLVPEEVWLTHLSASVNDENIDIVLTGASSKNSSIASFQQRLQAHKSTSSVQLLSTESKINTEENSTFVEFKIVLQI